MEEPTADGASTAPTVFNHSVKVPNQYRVAARTLKKTFEEGASLKGQIFQEKHARTNRLLALIQKISDNKHVIDRLIAETQLREKEPRLDKYMCAVLMTELLFGCGHLSGESKPVECIRRYGPQFRAILDRDRGSGEPGQAAGAAAKGEAGGDAEAGKLVYKKAFEKPRYVRVNTNQLSRADALELFVKDGWVEREFAADTQTYEDFLALVRSLGDFEFVSDMHVRNLFVFPATSKRFWARNELVKESKLILQDKASCLPTVLLDPPRGATILDMCAAPGMKTSHLAAHIKNKGTIYAVEQHQRRYGTLCEIMANTRSTGSVQTINQDALALTDDGVPGAQYILVDPSCSGSGMTGRLFADADHNKDAGRLQQLSGLQQRMLQHAMRAFGAAKKIVYSTCSVHVEENEAVVQRCLEACPEWELVKPQAFADRWRNFGSAKWKHVGKKCFYAKPEVDLTDGFFVAVFEKRADAEAIVAQQAEALQAEWTAYDKSNVGEAGYDEYFSTGFNARQGQGPRGNPFGANARKAERNGGGGGGWQRNAKPVEPEVVADKGRKPIAVEEAQISQEKNSELAEPVKQKKEKKKKSDKELAVEQPAVVEETAEQPPSKKSKKRKVEESSGAEAKLAEPDVVEEMAEVPHSKKSKKHKHQETAEAQAVAEIGEEPHSKKSKKRKHQETSEVEVIKIAEPDVADATSAGVEKKKKKKRSKEEQDGAADSVSVEPAEIVEPEVAEKKKKKKKDKHVEL